MKHFLLLLLFAATVLAQTSGPIIIQNQGVQIGTAIKLNCGTGLTCTVASGVASFAATGGAAASIVIGTTAVTGGNAQDVLYITSAGKLGQDDNFQWLHTATVNGQTGLTFYSIEPDLTCCDGPGNLVSAVDTTGVLQSNYVQAVASGTPHGIGETFYISLGTPSSPQNLPSTGSQFVTHYTDVIGYCDGAYQYLGNLDFVFQPTSNGNTYPYGEFQLTNNACPPSSGSTEIQGLVDQGGNGYLDYIANDVNGNIVAKEIFGATSPSSLIGNYLIIILNDGAQLGGMTFTGSGANTTLTITSASGTANYVGTNAALSGLGAGGFVKAAPTTGLLSVVSSAGGGVPVCVSNTGSASSTAYTCSDGGGSTFTAGYATIWQPGTNDTANTTGAPTLAVDGASAATIVRVIDGVSTPLGFPTVGKTFAGVQFLVTWNGTHWQIDGLGNTGPYASSNATGGIGTNLGTGATDNTCFGALSCSAAGIVSNGDNTAVGYEALDSLTSGASNTVIGSKAGTGMVTGSNNFFGGYEACNAATGGNNVCIGYEAAIGAINHSLTSGSNNVIIGDQTDLNGSGSFSNSICIGHEAICQASNTANIGDSAVTDFYAGAGSAAGHFGAMNASGAVTLSGLTNAATGDYVCYNAGLIEYDASTCTLSLAKYKQHIAPLRGALEEIMRLKPVQYQYRPEMKKGAALHVGFIAEDVAKVDPRIAAYTDKGVLESVDYEHITALDTKAIQEMQGEIVSLRHEVEALQAAVKALMGKQR